MDPERQRAQSGLGAFRAKLGRGAATPRERRSPSTAVPPETPATLRDGTTKPASELRSGDVVVVRAGEIIPGDGVVIEGMAIVEEWAITGESAPVIRESGTDRSAVTGGARVIAEAIVVEIS